ncbi:MAG TPA: DinB family protein [Acidobacteriaceae bacterium]
MSQIPAWFERRFEFSFPVEMLPNLCARLRSAAVRLEEELSEQPREVLIKKPQGKWSAQEHTGHLLDMETLWLARLNDYMAGREQLTPADLTNRKTDEANHNERLPAEILAKFRTQRARLLTSVAALHPSAFARSIPHPRLQTPMRLVDHLYFVAEHDDHHIAQIWELIHNTR